MDIRRVKPSGDQSIKDLCASAFAGISLVIKEGAKMMHTCYGRDWSCAENMAAANHDLLQAGTVTQGASIILGLALGTT